MMSDPGTSTSPSGKGRGSGGSPGRTSPVRVTESASEHLETAHRHASGAQLRAHSGLAVQSRIIIATAG